MEHQFANVSSKKTPLIPQEGGSSGIQRKLNAWLLVLLIFFVWCGIFLIVFKELTRALFLLKMSFFIGGLGFTLIGMIFARRLHPQILRLNWKRIGLALTAVILIVYIFFPTIQFLAGYDDLYLAVLKLRPGSRFNDAKRFAPTLKALSGTDGVYRVELSKRDLQSLMKKRHNIISLQVPRERFRVEKALALPTGSAHPLVREIVQTVSADSLMHVIRSLEGFGTRVEGSLQQDSAGAWIIKKFEQYGLDVTLDKFVMRRLMPDILWLNLIDSLTMIVLESTNTLYATSDGGNTFSTIKGTDSPALHRIYFGTATCGWGFGKDGNIYRTTDGGRRWKLQRMDTSVVDPVLKPFSADECIMIGRYGRVLRTTDGGKRWKQLPTGVRENLYAIEVTNDKTLWIAGSSGMLLRSTDSGSTWNRIPTGVSHDLTSIHLWDSKVGSIVCRNSVILKTTDGGLSWKQLEYAKSNPHANDVYFIDALHGYLVTDHIYWRTWETIDGGESWNPCQGDIQWLHEFTYDKHKTFAGCGFYGGLIISKDRGKTWTSVRERLYHSDRLQSKNVCATLRGAVNPEKVVIIVGHYDSADDAVPGANDNASGVAAVLEAARICSNYKFNHTIIFLAVAAEELGLIGSQHYAEAAKLQGMNITAVINGDMLGYPVLQDPKRIAISTSPPWSPLLDSVLIMNRRYNLNLVLDVHLERYGGSDHVSFLRQGYPALEISEGTAMEIWGGLDPYYHKPTDTSDKLSPELVQNCSRIMTMLLAEMAQPIAVAPVRGMVGWEGQR